MPAVVAKGEFAAGFGVPSYMAFEEVPCGLRHQVRGPEERLRDPEPMAVLAGAKHPRAARAFLEFLLTRARPAGVHRARACSRVMPKYKVQGPPGSVAEKVVGFTGGVRSFFETETVSVYDEDLAEKPVSGGERAVPQGDRGARGTS